MLALCLEVAASLNAAAALPERIQVLPSSAGDRSWLVMLHRALVERKAIVPLASEGSRPSRKSRNLASYA